MKALGVVLIGMAGFFLMIAGVSASTVNHTGPWTPIITGGSGLLFFISGLVLFILGSRDR